VFINKKNERNLIVSLFNPHLELTPKSGNGFKVGVNRHLNNAPIKIVQN